MHFNHNADRKVLLGEDGRPRFRQKWSKAEKRWTIVPLKEVTTYGEDHIFKCFTSFMGLAA